LPLPYLVIKWERNAINASRKITEAMYAQAGRGSAPRGVLERMFFSLDGLEDFEGAEGEAE
jgi:hypothetical protein